MPDAHGNIKGFAHTRKSAAAWERVFGPKVVRPDRDKPAAKQ